MDKRDVTTSRLLSLAHEGGLAVRGRRCQCPSCRHDDPRSVSISEPDGYAVWKCQRCQQGGSAVDFLAALRSISVAEALVALRDVDAARFATTPATPPTKRVDAVAVWNAATKDDGEARRYLKGRGLEAALELGAARCNVGRSREAWADRKAGAGYRIVVPLRDATGQIRTAQLRAVRPVEPAPAKLSLPGRYEQHVALGSLEPGEDGTIPAKVADVVAITEGIADTLAMIVAGFTTVGAAGSRQQAHLAEFLGEPKGRAFLVMRQRDANAHAQADAEEACQRLAHRLTKAGGRVRLVWPPEQFKDPAEWLQHVGDPVAFRALVEGPQLVAPPASSSSTPSASSSPEASASSSSSDGGAARQMAPPEPETPRTWAPSYASICAILRTPSTVSRVLDGPLEWNAMLHGPTVGRAPLEDEHVSAIRERIELHFRDHKGRPLEVGEQNLQRAVAQVARERTYHPVADYLVGLSWDGTPRIEDVLEDVLGAEKSELNLRLMRRWFVGAVARALEPGCKHDLVLILHGQQGLRKSSFFEALAARAEWFSDNPIDLHDKDAKLLLRSIWFLEWAELESMQRASRASTAKAFISSRVDQFRPPYGRAMVTAPRHAIIVGTTNEREILEDVTGNRRYWILPVTQVIELDVLREWRDQLWAEAVAAFRAGEEWHLTPADEAAMGAQQDAWRKRDPWEGPILGWAAGRVQHISKNADLTIGALELARRVGFSGADVLAGALDKLAATWTAHDLARVARVLTGGGYVQRRIWTGGAGSGEPRRRARLWLPAVLGVPDEPDDDAQAAVVEARSTARS